MDSGKINNVPQRDSRSIAEALANDKAPAVIQPLQRPAVELPSETKRDVSPEMKIKEPADLSPWGPKEPWSWSPPPSNEEKPPQVPAFQLKNVPLQKENSHYPIQRAIILQEEKKEEKKGKKKGEEEPSEIELSELLRENFGGISIDKFLLQLKKDGYFEGLRLGDPTLTGYGNSQNLTITCTVPGKIKSLQFNDLKSLVARNIITHIYAIKSKPSSKLGNIKVLQRKDFPAFIKNIFSDARGLVSSEQDLMLKNVHLRHVVMSSWFRALPDIFRIAFDEPELDEEFLEGKKKTCLQSVNQLIKDLSGIEGKTQSAPEFADLETAVIQLQQLLQHLPTNLYAGEGAENSIIGFLSHGFTNLGFKALNEKAGLKLEEGSGDIGLLASKMVDELPYVKREDKEEWKSDTKISETINAFFKFQQDDLLSPNELSNLLLSVGFTLGIDFIKGKEYMPEKFTQSDEEPVKKLQEALLSVGDALYSLIINGNKSSIDITQIEKLLSRLEIVTDTTKKLSRKKKSPEKKSAEEEKNKDEESEDEVDNEEEQDSDQENEDEEPLLNNNVVKNEKRK
jgi:hypothetical protein